MPDSELPEEFTDRIFANTYLTLKKISEALNVIRYEISYKRTIEVASFLAKDLNRLVEAQTNAVSVTKYAAYWGFWIRKIKPVSAWEKVEDREEEITDINERIALELSITLLKRAGKDENCPVRSSCKASCDGAQCIEKHTSAYFKFSNKLFSEYLIYSLGKRTFGPHHICAVLDSLVFAACEDPGGTSI